MQDIIERLSSFNRVERSLLIGMALGNPTFSLAPKFRAALKSTFGLEVPAHAFAAMDYHLDWLHASLAPTYIEPVRNVYPRNPLQVAGNIEDLDLLIAYECEEQGHIIMIEAKGVTSHRNDQMRSKANRLGAIFGEEGTRIPNVTPHFGLLSPVLPQKLVTDCWPRWMLREGAILHVPLHISGSLRKVLRCDSKGNPAKNGEYWTVTNERDFLTQSVGDGVEDLG